LEIIDGRERGRGKNKGKEKLGDESARSRIPEKGPKNTWKGITLLLERGLGRHP